MSLTARVPSQELIDIVGALGGRWHGHTAMCRCPAHDDRSPSLSLRQGDRGILVTCFAGCDAADVLRELARVRPGRRFAAPPPIPSGGRANVDRLWQEAGPIEGGLGARYLASRRLDRIPPDVRFLPRCPHGAAPLTRFEPALLVAVRDGTSLVALQRIFLEPRTARGLGKATLGMLGQAAWRGHLAGGALALAEGFETAEAFSILHDLPCWASLGARRLDQVMIPSSVTSLLIAADNDREGRRAAIRAREHYARPGRDVRVIAPPWRFNDWADVLAAKAERGGGPGG